MSTRLLKKVEALARDLAHMISGKLPGGWGFGLFLFTFKPGATTWISNANREDMHGMLRDYLDRAQTGKDNELDAPSPPSTPMHIGMVPTRYEFPDRDSVHGAGLVIKRRRQRVGPPLWAVCDQAGNVWTRQQEWEWEPQPSSRDDAFLERARWSLLEAVAVVAVMERFRPLFSRPSREEEDEP
mgnify:CR=1 FL=1